MNDITNSDDVIDSRDILEYIEKYEDDKEQKDHVFFHNLISKTVTDIDN